MQKTATKRVVNGVLLLDKPVGISSNTALQQVRRLYQAFKAGHTGILDPLASGLLPVCFGEATKFAQYLLDADKAYRATLRLGVATSTGDAEGEVVASGHVDVNRADFEAACRALMGASRQTPPMFSALKHEGRPLYEYARKGIVIERKARDIVVHHMNVLSFDAPDVVWDVVCSKGTYVRTLAEDLAKHLGTFAYLTALRRTATAGFTIEHSHSIDAVQSLDLEQRDALLLPCDVLVAHLPKLVLATEAIARLRFGQAVVQAQHWPEQQLLRGYDEQDNFIGLVRYQTGQLVVVRLIAY